MIFLLSIALVILAIPVCFFTAYLLLLAVLPVRRLPALQNRDLRFDVIVPAHNEAAVIERTVRSLLQCDWPQSHFRVVVVADNCSDDTAELARAAGATVLVRNNLELRGKGYALHLAYAWSAEQKYADAVVVVDADTEVTSNLLLAFATRLAAGAMAVQATYGVLNPQASWRTRLMAVAMALFNRVRPRGRDRIGASTGLRGNGMCFTHALLRQVPHKAFSIAEDLEYGLHLTEAGIRVWFAEEAEVLGEMVSGEAASRSQRRRWEGGRTLMAQQHAPILFKMWCKKPSILLLDMLVDLITPPLGYIGVWAMMVLGLGLTLGLYAQILWPIFPGLFCVVALSWIVACGVYYSRMGWAGALEVLKAPRYILWKLLKAPPVERSGEWVRTEREANQKSDKSQ